MHDGKKNVPLVVFVLEIVPRLQRNKLVQSQNKKAKMELVFCNFLVGKFIYKKVNNQQANTGTKS